MFHQSQRWIMILVVFWPCFLLPILRTAQLITVSLKSPEQRFVISNQTLVHHEFGMAYIHMTENEPCLMNQAGHMA